jgi:carboxymethylenebutenolidase
MQIEQTEVEIATPGGRMPAVLTTPDGPAPRPAVLLLMEAFGVTPHIREVAARIAREGYAVLVPDLYYRELPNNKFGYREVEQAMAMMYRLDFGEPMKEDIGAALAYLKSLPDVRPNRIGVTGFCLGGGLAFFTACRLSAEIAAAAPFYGMVLDEWIEAVKDVTVPVHLFFGGADPFIPPERVRQVESRFRELGKEYTLKVYPEANHGFFCNERSTYNRAAAEDAWRELTGFFRKHLQDG